MNQQCPVLERRIDRDLPLSTVCRTRNQNRFRMEPTCSYGLGAAHPASKPSNVQNVNFMPFLPPLTHITRSPSCSTIFRPSGHRESSPSTPCILELPHETKPNRPHARGVASDATDIGDQVSPQTRGGKYRHTYLPVLCGDMEATRSMCTTCVEASA